MCIPIHAYLIGRAHRIEPFRDVLDYICNGHKDEVWVTTAVEIAEHYLENYYDAAVKDIARYNAA